MTPYRSPLTPRPRVSDRELRHSSETRLWHPRWVGRVMCDQEVLSLSGTSGKAARGVTYSVLPTSAHTSRSELLCHRGRCLSEAPITLDSEGTRDPLVDFLLGTFHQGKSVLITEELMICFHCFRSIAPVWICNAPVRVKLISEVNWTEVTWTKS